MELEVTSILWYSTVVRVLVLNVSDPGLTFSPHHLIPSSIRCGPPKLILSLIYDRLTNWLDLRLYLNESRQMSWVCRYPPNCSSIVESDLSHLLVSTWLWFHFYLWHQFKKTSETLVKLKVTVSFFSCLYWLQISVIISTVVYLIPS